MSAETISIPRNPTPQWCQRVAKEAGVWPGDDAPIGIWGAVYRYHEAMVKIAAAKEPT